VVCEQSCKVASVTNCVRTSAS